MPPPMGTGANTAITDIRSAVCAVDLPHLGLDGAGLCSGNRVVLALWGSPDQVGDILGIRHPIMFSDYGQSREQPLPTRVGWGTKACAARLPLWIDP